MREDKNTFEYAKRLKSVTINRKFWHAWEVSERLKIKGVKKGIGIENVKTILVRATRENLVVLETVEEVIEIRKQILEIKPMALESKASIILEYQKAVGLVNINGKITPSHGAAIKDPIFLRTKEGIIEKYNSKLNALKATLLD